MGKKYAMAIIITSADGSYQEDHMTEFDTGKSPLHITSAITGAFDSLLTEICDSVIDYEVNEQ